ncbi:MAG: glycosyltransferase family 2 protein [Candidatus Hodarchaeales archaeon]|jgi:glycosyltransferase involved in cell wall biosynthesis
MKLSDFLVLIPAFNEEDTLPEVIQQLEKIFSRDQIILADDGSTDTTHLLARQLGIRIIKNRNNRGKGHILRHAFAVIIQKFPYINWVMTIDADGQHDPRDIPLFLQTIDRYPETEIILGKRDYNQMPSVNQISNKLTSNWSNYWLGWNLQDLQCGFRCYQTVALRYILKYGLTKNKFDLETEILLVAWLLNLKIIDVPVTTLYPKNRRKSRIQPVIDTTRWMLLVMQFGFSPRFVNKVWQNRYLQHLQRKRINT